LIALEDVRLTVGPFELKNILKENLGNFRNFNFGKNLNSHFKSLLSLIGTSEVSQQQCVIQAEWREEQIFFGIGFVHGIEEVGGEDCQALVKVPRLVFVFRVVFDVIGQAQLTSCIRKDSDEEEKETPNDAHPAMSV
jgi:hypothetical protein